MATSEARPRRKRGGAAVLTLLCCALSAGYASPATATPLGDGAACALIEGVPGRAHPLRKHPALRALLAAVDGAGRDRKKNARALERIDKLLVPVYAEAERLFSRPVPTRDGAVPEFRHTPARAFLERWVLAPNAPLRVGRDRFEPAPELASAMMLAACRSDQRARAIAIGRGASGAEARAQRAFAALLLLGEGRLDEARELTWDVGEEGFLAPFVQAELAVDPDARERLHALAGRHLQTPEQEAAWHDQARRFALEAP